MDGQREVVMCNAPNRNNRDRKKSRTSFTGGSESLPGFREYSCGNVSCVLSRFDKFSMAHSDDPCCPICGQPVPEHGSAAGAN
jgi:hypothetical protein